eukprot:TRINITY_DN14015_c0_g1_i1.p1 TRINITY_DN14015_c0_g1~~TRINITY_DN14015_c0_g1_i1.p1  ORF type:complete len:130 (+),score=32.94 TRINITY_DN14015_c0_g1_i1:2-391(+)
MRALISLFLPQQFIWKKTIAFEERYVVDLEKLRIAVSTISHKAYACAKLRINNDKDIRKGKKNFVQSLRYLLFGEQLIDHGKIVDYQCANEFHRRIFLDQKEDWNHINSVYKPEIDAISDHFKKRLPRD